MRFLFDGIHLLQFFLSLPLTVFRILTGPRSVEGLWRRVRGATPRLPDSRPVIWLHASSIGEVLLLRPMLAGLRHRLPDFQTVISVETRDGFQAATQAYPEALLFYVPLDLSWCVRRVYSALRPRLLVLSELELWPNLLLEAKRRGLPVAVVSSRMNDVDFRFFTRINRLHRPALAAIAWWGAQVPRDAGRIRQLIGSAPTTVAVTGSLKFDVVPDERAVAAAGELLARLGFSPQERILLAGSTHAPEERLLLDAFLILARAHPELRLILAPRDSRRFAEVARLLRRGGVPFTQRSRIATRIDQSAPVTLIDSHGELPALWPHVDFVFVGGSLAAGRGGQNVIEPAAVGKPVCFGPEVWNFPDAAAGLLAAGGARQVQSAAEIVATVGRWLDNPAEARRIGENARSYVQSRRGAADQTLQALLDLLGRGHGQQQVESMLPTSVST